MVIAVVIMILNISDESRSCARSFSLTQSRQVRTQRSFANRLKMRFDKVTIGNYNSNLTSASMTRERNIKVHAIKNNSVKKSRDVNSNAEKLALAQQRVEKDIQNLSLEMEAISETLASFNRYGEDEANRLVYLRGMMDANRFFERYLDYPKVLLQQEKGQLRQKEILLQEKEGRLQKKEILLQEKEGRLQKKEGRLQQKEILLLQLLVGEKERSKITGLYSKFINF
jgi:hypothetical protein